MIARWTRVAAVALTVTTIGLGPAAITAPAAPIAPSTPAHGLPDPVQRSDRSPEFLELGIDSVTPSVVTTTSDQTVSVTATVTNVGDRRVNDVDVRLQRAPAVATSAELRTTLKLDQQNFDVVGTFITVADHLDVGQHKQFTLTMPLRPSAQTDPGTPTLRITDPGVYPMLLNVNGQPAYGNPARLDDARFLLPVLGLPADPTVTDAQQPQSRPIAPSTDSPIAVTMLWPLADKPRLAAGIPGSLDQPVRLVDDDLATSLAPGGRLDQLVGALEFALRPNVDRDHKLAQSICLAVDPDLLITVSNMARGYLVVADPSNPMGPAREGTGAQVAAAWLDRVRNLADNVCTVALPFAQVDLTALRQIHNSALSTSAVVAPADIVDSILATTSKRGITWPDSGTVDDNTAAMLAGLGTKTLLVSGNAVAANVDEAIAPPDVVRVANLNADAGTATAATASTAEPELHAATFDVSAATALAAVGSQPQTPSFTPSKARYDLTGDSRPARLQDALGALAWPALTPQPDHPRSLFIAPPQQWSVDGNEASAVLSQVATLIRSGLAVPRTLDTLVSEPADARPFTANYPQHAVDDAIPDSIRLPAAEQAGRIDTLTAALVDDPNSELTPQRFSAPLREDLLRAMSLSGRRDATRANSELAGYSRVIVEAASMDTLLKGVTVLAPGGVYTLASEQSPLLLVARNDLPVGIRVRLKVDAPSDMHITDIGEQQLPPRGSRALQVPAEVNDSRSLVVDVSLTTPTGQALGDPTTVSVRSNAYGKPLAIITACAGALLLLLAGRRLWHRFRGQPDPADKQIDV
ncbi:glycoprotein [Skermania sp. ID1734]|uniref:DUF6049 family protein n=1 Tax=Skermania sp. ID1734 TaxID=2597516 RepID=UPI00117D3CF4|nr:DUF6049 family protein [Skermania sp. ID1734]TSD99270.1 glycoprotein [Skermania sp. ID1734]